MPFWLHNAAQTFQQFMDTVIHGLCFMYMYIDDVLVASSSEEEHKLQLQLVFEHFCEPLVNASKCEFGAPSLQFLRHIIDKNGIHPLDTKVATVRYFRCPSSRRQLQKFLGMINFYQCFIQHCAQALQPLHTLLTHQWRMKVIIIGGGGLKLSIKYS